MLINNEYDRMVGCGASQLFGHDQQNAFLQEKDPTSAEYRRIQQDRAQERGARQAKKRKLEHERRTKAEVDLLGF